MNKIIIAVLAVLILSGLGAWYWHSQHSQLAGASPSGATFGDSKQAAVVVNLANPGANGTSTSLLNTDSNDRYVTSVELGCENVGTSLTAYTGTGLANLLLSVGTTTTAAPASFNGFANVAQNIKLSTSTVNLEVSSTTLALATSSLAAVWPTNTYMTFFFNATNTAACTVGVKYLGS